jgi:hypothetical protein
MYITANSNKKKQYYKTNEVDKKKVEQKYLDKYKFSKDFISENNTRFYSTYTERNIITIDKEGEEDFLLIFRRKFDDIFKKIKGHEKIFEQLKKKSKFKNYNISDYNIKNGIYLKKYNFDKGFERKKIIKQPKVDVKKVIEIQKIFKGHLNRKINLNIDRLKLRQCLIELFCLLLYGNLCKAKIRINFRLLKEFYIASKLYAGEELTFMDRISFKLAHCFYSGTKINDLRSKNIGEELKTEEEEKEE